ncbi:MAG: CpaB [Oscillospiraceae bacterium]|jgi:pilus assembly protein CpaB|nr:CpaB [Oscillospiraceae bacterium]
MKKVKFLAFISAVATALLLYIFLNSLGRDKDADKLMVFTAALDIPANTPISAEMLTMTELPVEAVIAGAISDSTRAIGKVCESKIFTGEQLLSSKLISAGDSASKTLAYAIKPGYRAITIAVDVTTGLSNMIIPGNHVDLIGDFLIQNKPATDTTVASTSADKISYTTMVLENITVLAVDNVLSEDGKLGSETPEYATLTLQVTPNQAMELSMAQFEGQIRVILRSPLDEKKTNLPSITLDKIVIK